MKTRIAALFLMTGITAIHVALPGSMELRLVALGTSALYLLIHFLSLRAGAQRSDLASTELSVGLAVFAVLLTELAGARLAPVSYILAGFMGAFLPPVSTGVAVVTMSMLSALLGMDGWPWMAGFSTLFAVLGHLALSMEVSALRRRYEERVNDFIERLEEEASTFRLAGSSRTSTEHDDEETQRLLTISSLKAIHQNSRYVLDSVKKVLGLDSVLLIWRGWDESTARVVEYISPYSVRETSFPVRSGILSQVFKTGMALNLAPFRNPVSVLTHYQGEVSVGSVMAVPVLDHGHVKAVIYGDRRREESFSEEQIGFALRAARSLLDLVTTERVLESVVRSKNELGRFFQASSLLNSALTVGQVVDSGIKALSYIMEYDTAAIVSVKEGTVRVLGAQGEPAELVVGKEFPLVRSILRMVVEGRHALPVDGELRDASQVVLTPEVPFEGIRSLWMVPLVSGDRILGAFVVGSSEPGVFSMDRRNMLSVIANQIAAALDNAFMYEKLEEMATTDGLTGLTIRRTLMERFSEMLERARRMGRPLSVLITDIDKFKSVNDTYGHQVGDEVIRKVARVLKSQARSIDLVGRYGGEEFVAVLEDTDGQGARNFAERVRQEVEKLVFDSEQGPFHSSISIGIATFPAHGSTETELIECADRALYHAKRTGRNRTIHFADIAHLANQS